MKDKNIKAILANATTNMFFTEDEIENYFKNGGVRIFRSTK